MTEEEPRAESTKYTITFSLDRSGFFRRLCPSCGRDFKTKADEADLVSIVQPAFRQQGLEVGEKRTSTETSQTVGAVNHLHCPYCDHQAEVSDMLTSEFEDYMKRYMMREVLLPKIDRMFSEIEDAFGHQSPHSGGLFSLEISFKHDRSLLPPRPISGPEPPDMVAVNLLCCGKSIRILDGWSDLIYCPHCGLVLALQ